MRVNRREFLETAGTTAAMSAVAGCAPASLTPAEASPAVPATSEDLCFISGRELATLIRTRKLSAREVMSAHLGQIRRVNPKINAIVAKLDDDQCLALADEADRRMARGEQVGPLHGLPFAFKDRRPWSAFPSHVVP
jgi:amidase